MGSRLFAATRVVMFRVWIQLLILFENFVMFRVLIQLLILFEEKRQASVYEAIIQMYVLCLASGGLWKYIIIYRIFGNFR